MAITLDEIQSDEMINEFKRFMHFLTPKDKDIFLKKLMEEIEEAKKRDFEEQLEAPSEQNAKEQQQTDEFITDMQQTIIEESQNIAKDSPQEMQESITQQEVNQPIYHNRHNPEQLAFLESEIPPHIMEAAAEYSERKADEAEALADMAEALEEKVKIFAQQVRNFRQSLKK
ncbi:hypothetical protein [Helicobacter cinaedi]|uniref:hypothetical protein n=1 Tax=Helicobacter cinaedi TaxID=213 RepID=UPI001FB43CFA|nr:hypothetical protein [Helicobacter cinaedi]